jgi:hypothetical protein
MFGPRSAPKTAESLNRAVPDGRVGRVSQGAEIAEMEDEKPMRLAPKTSSALLVGALFFASAALSQTVSNQVQQSSIGYSDLADLAFAGRVAVIVTVRDVVHLKDADATGVSPGFARFYIEGDVNALIAGPGGLPAAVSWIADVPMTSANRLPKLKKAKLILLARPLAGKPGVLQLVSKSAQLPWTPETEQRLRAILSEANGPSAPPVVTGIGHAFHVAGSIPGEGETQIFLKTADNRPVSLNIQRHPGEDPRWTVSLGEIVDDAAAAPQRDTLLWYRLACALPPSLPDDAIADQASDDAQAAQADYKLVLDGLGACGRTVPAN